METRPLSSGFMLTSIIGFFIAIYYVYPAFPDWGFAFLTLFVILFVASVVSMTYTELDHKLDLHINEGFKKKDKERILKITTKK